MALEIDVVKKCEGVFVVSPVGSIDSDTSYQLKNQIDALLFSSAKVLILNMERVAYISSMGIGVILSSKKAIEDAGGTFIMTNLQPQIKTIFEIIKNLPNMRVFQNMEEADRYLTEIQRKETEKHKGIPED